MKHSTPYWIKPGTTIDLNKFPAADTGPFKNKGEAEQAITANLKRLSHLQEVLYAQAKHAVLIVFQAMDAGGKDGAIKHVFSGLNPQGCAVTSFKVPTSLELAHDYLWRYHMHVPPRGMIGIFNRSHYESVLVERVRDIAPKSVWSRRYEQINQFEAMLASEGVTILKFYLHISKQEQKKRLEARLSNKEKNWKFDPQDLVERKRWSKYMSAYSDALSKCSTSEAPWFVVPSDQKWFRNWVLSDTIVHALEQLDLEYPQPIKGIEKLVVE